MVSLRPLWIPVLAAIACHFGAEVVRAGDAEKRARERNARTSGDAALCLGDALRSGLQMEAAKKLILADEATLQAWAEANGTFLAKNHKPPRPEHLSQIRREWQREAEWWYNAGARELKTGDQFVTNHGEHRWTKVIAGPKEVWRGPDGLLVGDVVGQMTHFDAQRIDRALKKLYDQAIQVGGEWKWPENFDPKAFLKHEMEQSVSAADLPGGDPYNNDAHDVARFFDPLIASIGGVLEPNVPWGLPIQEGYGIENPGPTREWSALRQQGALEVLNDTLGRWFWSSSVLAAHSYDARSFSGRVGVIGYDVIRAVVSGSVRVVARVRQRG